MSRLEKGKLEPEKTARIWDNKK